MEYTTKLAYQSNFWYNDGLKKANIRDLSGAIASLKRSLQYNTANVAARNLLGLVYYGRGEVVEALVEWILSKNFQSGDNIANYYIAKIMEVPGELEAVNRDMKLYNQSLEFARQNGEDLAIIQLKKVIAGQPNFVKAYQLLALLYMKNEQYTEARKLLRVANRLDTTDEITLRYIHEITQIRKERPVKARDIGGPQEKGATVTYNIGNESIISPTSQNFRENLFRKSGINVLFGLVIGVLVMWFLVLPATMSSRQKSTNEQMAQFSDQIATQEAQISALKTELDGFRAEDEVAEEVVSFTGADAQNAYEVVMKVQKQYKGQETSDKDMVDQLLTINTAALGPQGKKIYDSYVGKVYKRFGKRQYAEAKDALSSANYEGAITALNYVVGMNFGYDGGKAALTLAQTYQQVGKNDEAKAQYESIITILKEGDVVNQAKEALNALGGVAQTQEQAPQQSQE